MDKSIKQIAKAFLTIYASFLLFSCGVRSYEQNVRYVPISIAKGSQKATNVSLFFEGENIPFQYESLGTVRINNMQESTHVYNLMKQKAYDVNGNTVINIKTINESEVYTDSDDKVQTRNSKYFTGLIVQQTNFNDFEKEKVDTSFLSYNRNYETQLNDPGTRAAGFFLSLLIGSLMAIWSVYVEE